jgi:hypothetical protein
MAFLMHISLKYWSSAAAITHLILAHRWLVKHGHEWLVILYCHIRISVEVLRRIMESLSNESQLMGVSLVVMLENQT